MWITLQRAPAAMGNNWLFSLRLNPTGIGEDAFSKRLKQKTEWQRGQEAAAAKNEGYKYVCGELPIPAHST